MRKFLSMALSTFLVSCMQEYGSGAATSYTDSYTRLLAEQREQELRYQRQRQEEERTRPARYLAAMRRIAQDEHHCQTVSLIRIAPNGSDDQRDSYEFNVCGTRRIYSWLFNPSTGNLFGAETTEGRPSVCERIVSSRGTHMLRTFYLRRFSTTGVECINLFLSQGWHLSSTRTVHNGDTTLGWGEENIFTRQ